MARTSKYSRKVTSEGVVFDILYRDARFGTWKVRRTIPETQMKEAQIKNLVAMFNKMSSLDDVTERVFREMLG